MTNQIVITALKVIEDQRKKVREILKLSEDELNWQPQPERNSLATLIEHSIGAEAFWIQEGIKGKGINRNRTKEFEYRVRSKKQLQIAYESTAKITKETLEERITDDQIFEERIVRDRPKTILWILLHMIEHNYYHIGQMQYIKGMLSDTKNIFERINV